MLKKISTDYEGHNIQLINSALECKLIIDGEVADVYWGPFAFNVRLFGQIKHEDKIVKIKVIFAAKLFRFHCAIFAENVLIESSIPISST